MSATPADGSRQPVRVGACLSLTGRYARFGTQAARGLEAWRSLDGAAELIIEDDQSSPRTLESALPRVAARCDVLLGPYSTQLMKIAGRMAADEGWLLWNHGGAGDDVEAAHPGHIVSVLTPAGRYAQPFVRYLADRVPRTKLWITHGRGGFGRQVAAGAEAAARRAGIDATLAGQGELPADSPSADRSLLCAGTFEEDIETVKSIQAMGSPPGPVCAVAAGVREFGDSIAAPEGIFGVGQWFPGAGGTPDTGPTEESFLASYLALSPAVPDYPAVQAAAGAALAARCARLGGGISREVLWRAASSLNAQTLFGGFRIGPDGSQEGHEAVLVRWTTGGPVSA